MCITWAKTRMSIRSYLTNEGDHGGGPVPSFFMLCWLRWRALNQSSCGQASLEDRLSYPVQLTLLLNLNLHLRILQIQETVKKYDFIYSLVNLVRLERAILTGSYKLSPFRIKEEKVCRDDSLTTGSTSRLSKFQAMEFKNSQWFSSSMTAVFSGVCPSSQYIFS